MSYEGSLRELSRRSGVDWKSINAAANARAGLSLDASRRVAGALKSQSPVTLFVLTQSKALKARADRGDEAGVLRGISHVVQTLKALESSDLDAEGRALTEALHDFYALMRENQQTVQKAFGERVANDPDNPATLSNRTERDAFGAVVRARRNPKRSRDSFGIRVKTGPGTSRDGLRPVEPRRLVVH